MKNQDPDQDDYEGVPIRRISGGGRPPKQFMSARSAKGRGRRSAARGGWLTENEQIRKREEFDKKAKKRKSKRRRKRK